MAFTEDTIDVERYWPMHFYMDADVIANSSINETITKAKKFRIGDIRLHFSGGVTSAADFMINVSSILGSRFNVQLLSQDIQGSTDVFLHYSSYLQFNSGDHVVFTTSTFSVVNSYGIEVFGWAVVG